MALPAGASSSYSPRFDSKAIIRSDRGVFNLSDVTFVGEPHSTVVLRLTSPAVLDPHYSFSADLSFRKCLAGEEFTSDGQCRECPPETYLLEVASSPTTCKECPPNAECFGGGALSPQPGYWRSSSTSLNFLPCYFAAACLGSPDPLTHSPQGECLNGHRGILCAQCETGFSRDPSFECRACPP